MVFIQALNPDFVWEHLGENFKGVTLGLLKNRSGRAEESSYAKVVRAGEWDEDVAD